MHDLIMKLILIVAGVLVTIGFSIGMFVAALVLYSWVL